MKLREVEEFERLRKQAKERLGRLDTNCYMGASALADAAAAGALDVQEVGQGLLALIDEGAYERLYYFLARDAAGAFPSVEAEKPVVLEEIDSAGRRKDAIDALGARLAQAGWRKLAYNLQVSSDLRERAEEIGQLYAQAVAKLEANGLSLVRAGAEHAPEVTALWREHLRPTDVPGAHFGFADDPAQHAVCALDAQGRVCGVNWWEFRGRTCEVRHTVTHPAYLHRGIAFALLMAAQHDACEQGSDQVLTYIDDANFKSLGLYRKAGIEPNGRTSTQFLLPK